MYAGPGIGSHLAGAAAWSALCEELVTIAQVHRSVLAELATTWRGVSSTNAVTSGLTYALWLETTAAAAAQTATKLSAAASAYETAHAAHVPPPVIAANRSLLAMLVATNFLGINTPAIAATEAHYVEMWAQDAAAMYTYFASSAATWQLDPFTPAKPVTTPVGIAAQSVSAAPTGGVQSILSTLNIFAPGSNMQTTGLPGLLNLFSGTTNTAFGSFITSNFLTTALVNTPASSGLLSPAGEGVVGGSGGTNDQQQPQQTLPPGVVQEPGQVPTYPLPVSPQGSTSSRVGGLTVPEKWVSQTTPQTTPAATPETTPAAGYGAPGMVGAAPSTGKFGQQPRYGRKLTVMPTTLC